MRIYKIILSILILVTFISVFPQEFTHAINANVSGTVLDNSGRPISGANVNMSVNGQYKFSITNGFGRYMIYAVPGGKFYTINASKTGYAGATSYNYVSGTSLIKNFTLTKNALPPPQPKPPTRAPTRVPPQPTSSVTNLTLCVYRSNSSTLLNANIILSGYPKGSTGPDGCYTNTIPGFSIYTVVSANGYRSESKDISLRKGVQRENIYLTPIAPPTATPIPYAKVNVCILDTNNNPLRGTIAIQGYSSKESGPDGCETYTFLRNKSLSITASAPGRKPQTKNYLLTLSNIRIVFNLSTVITSNPTNPSQPTSKPPQDSVNPTLKPTTIPTTKPGSNKPTTTPTSKIATPTSPALTEFSLKAQVWKDANNNCVIDGGSPTLHNVRFRLEGTKNASCTTNSGGSCSIAGLKKGTYKMTLSPIPNGYKMSSCNDTSRSLSLSKNETLSYFITPISSSTTPKPSAATSPIATDPNTTYLKIKVLLNGIGAGGDSINPKANLLSNKSPKDVEIPVVVSLFKKSDNTLATKKSGTLIYSLSTQSYEGRMSLKDSLKSGEYKIVTHVPYHLNQIIPSLKITEKKITTLPSLTLVTGDANGDNLLNVADYNLLGGCYSEITPPLACDENQFNATDFNDDGYVNQYDYNLFLREIRGNTLKN